MLIDKIMIHQFIVEMNNLVFNGANIIVKTILGLN